MKNSILPLERRVLILSLSLSLIASVASAKQIFTPGNPDVIPNSEKVMDELYAVHPYGVPGAMTAFPDGSYAYVAEGGSVALLWSDPTLPQAPNNYKTPLWRKPVGSLGVYPMEMVLDPDMDFTEPALNSADPNALLYIAGGRDGLWVMNANVVPPTSGPIAFRIDDSGDSNPATQFGRKLCNDVKIMEVGGNKYVVAIFGATAHSILRVYTMQHNSGDLEMETIKKQRDGIRGLRLCTLLLGMAAFLETANAQQILWDHIGDGTTEVQLGPMAELGDIDGDGVGDFITPVVFSAFAEIQSGTDASVIKRHWGPSPFGYPAHFGGPVVALGDFDGDGTPDYSISSNAYSTSAQALVV